MKVQMQFDHLLNPAHRAKADELARISIEHALKSQEHFQVPGEWFIGRMHQRYAQLYTQVRAVKEDEATFRQMYLPPPGRLKQHSLATCRVLK